MNFENTQVKHKTELKKIGMVLTPAYFFFNLVL
jgi:hypothetical protein